MPERPTGDHPHPESAAVICFYSRIPHADIADLQPFDTALAEWLEMQGEVPERLNWTRRNRLRVLEGKMATQVVGHTRESLQRLLHRNCGWLIREMQERTRRMYEECGW